MRRCGIYQLDDEDKRLFWSYARIVKKNLLPKKEDYHIVYITDMDCETDEEALRSLYSQLNTEPLPLGFKGHTPSISDIIRVSVPHGSDRWYYIDKIGFKELKEFETRLYYVPVCYQMCGSVPVRASSPETAIQWAKEHMDELGLPENASYLTDSFEIDEEGLVRDEKGRIV